MLSKITSTEESSRYYESHYRNRDEFARKLVENHLHWLNRDCDGWEEMRLVLPDGDLRGCDLHGADLRYADLRSCDISCCNLNDIDFRYADLRGADFLCSSLANANLENAKLDHTFSKTAKLTVSTPE